MEQSPDLNQSAPGPPTSGGHSWGLGFLARLSSCRPVLLALGPPTAHVFTMQASRDSEQHITVNTHFEFSKRVMI